MFLFLRYRKNFVGTKNQVGISYGKQATGVPAIDVPLYYIRHSWFCQQLFHGTEQEEKSLPSYCATSSDAQYHRTSKQGAKNHWLLINNIYGIVSESSIGK